MMSLTLAPTLCAVDDCDRADIKARRLCTMHYQRFYDAGTLDDFELVQPERIGYPLVCECPDSDADLRRDFGMCSKCKRKPLALMAVKS